MARKILLADDSLTIQKVVELTFARPDYELIAVGSGDRALQTLKDFSPEIVLADAVMPGLTGYDVCEAVKRREDGRFIPVVLLTGTFEPFDRARAEQVGADAVVTKPFEPQALAAQVAELLQKADADRAAPPPPPTPPPPLEREESEEATHPEATDSPSGEEAPAEPTPSQTIPELSGDALYATTAIPIFTPEQIAELQPPSTESSSPAEPETFVTTSASEGAGEGAPEEPTIPLRSYPLDLGGLDEDLPRRDLDEDIAAFERSGKAVSRPDFWENVDSMPKSAPTDGDTSPIPADEQERFESAGVDATRDLEALAAEASLTDFKDLIPEAGAAVMPKASSGPLSDDDVDRIARRVVELVGEKVVRSVAWDVVPELAERLVKERLEELERTD